MALNAAAFLCLLAFLGGMECACPSGCYCYTSDRPNFLSSVNCNDMSEFPISFPVRTSEITMYNMKLSEIPPLAFRDVPYLQSVTIYSSKIGNIRACAFKGLRNLERLTIYSSNIDSIENYAFSDIRNVSHISIYASSIMELSSYAFYNMSEIQHISLYKLNITEVKPLAFYEIHQVSTFNFYMNTVAIIRSGVFAESSIKDVNIYSSFIEKLECGTLDVIKARVASNSFSFYLNKLVCDCNIYWMLQPVTKVFLQDSLKRIKCSNLPGSTKVSDLTPSDLACANNTGSYDSECAIPEGGTSGPECGKVDGSLSPDSGMTDESTLQNPEKRNGFRVTVSRSGTTDTTNNSTANWMKSDHIPVAFLVFFSFVVYEPYWKIF